VIPDNLHLDDPSIRRRLVDAYVGWIETKQPEYEWAVHAIRDAIWTYVDPEVMLDVVIEVINCLANDSAALNYIGAGPLEDLLGGTDVVMERAAKQALTDPAFREALATVYGVRYNEDGYGFLHDLVEGEVRRLFGPSD
jgi:hypothetical protein